MADKRMQHVSSGINLLAGIICIVVFFTARPYFKDFFESDEKVDDSLSNDKQQKLQTNAAISFADNSSDSTKLTEKVVFKSNSPDNILNADGEGTSVIRESEGNRPAEYNYIDEFNSNLNTWPVYSTSAGACSIINGKYIIKGNTEGTSMSIAKILATNQRALDISVIAKHIDGRMDSGYGIAFNANNDGSYYAFEIAGDHYTVFFVVRNERTELIPWTTSRLIKTQKDEANILRIRLKSNVVDIYINDFYINSCKINFGMGWLGIILENEQTVEFDKYSF